jgi:hypothetical protein
MLFADASASIKVLDNPNMQLVAVDVHNLYAGFLLVDKAGEVQWRNVRVVAFRPVPEEIARRQCNLAQYRALRQSCYIKTWRI